MDSDSSNTAAKTSKNRERKSRTLVPGITALNNHNDTNKRSLLVRVCPTTGGEFELTIPNTLTVEGLKHLIGNKLKIPMDRINLLFKDRILKTGSLLRHGVMDGCKFTLLPNVEAGLSSQKTDHSIMQVLENLSERQVNEFLAGRSPLTLAMRLGEHMMFLQLQLSSSPFGMRRLPDESTRIHHHHHHRHQHHHHQRNNRSNHFQPYLNNQHRSRLQQQNQQSVVDTGETSNRKQNVNNLPRNDIKNISAEDQPNKILPTVLQGDLVENQSSSPTNLMNIPPPILYKSPPTPTRLLNLSPSPSSSSFDSSIGSPSSSISSDDSYMSDCSTPSNSPPASPTGNPDPMTSTHPNMSSSSNCTYHHPPPKTNHNCSNSSRNKGKSTASTKRLFNAAQPILNEATKTLQQKIFELRQMSKIASNINEEKPSYVAEPAPGTSEGSKYPGAVINCMHHVGKGVYSGTFSGTLNPALHDGEGKPKKSLSTIVHILNDLLGAAPPGGVPKLDRRHHLESPGKREKYNLHHPSQHKSEGDHERLHKENEAMKNKVEQVQMMLEQRRQKRRAKREARSSPYGWSKPSVLSEMSDAKGHMEVNMEATSGLNETASGDENTSFTAGELKPEAVLV